MSHDNKQVLRRFAVSDDPCAPTFLIFCPACRSGHAFWVDKPTPRFVRKLKDGTERVYPGGEKWTWNGSMDKPTFRASLLIEHWDSDPPFKPTLRCHSFVTDGQIQFLSDSEHELRGQTVPLELF